MGVRGASDDERPNGQRSLPLCDDAMLERCTEARPVAHQAKRSNVGRRRERKAENMRARAILASRACRRSRDVGTAHAHVSFARGRYRPPGSPVPRATGSEASELGVGRVAPPRHRGRILRVRSQMSGRAAPVELLDGRTEQ